MGDGWYPPQWSQQTPLWSMTVTEQSGSVVSSRVSVPNDQGEPTGDTIGSNQQTTPQSNQTTYYFDAVLSSDHYTSRRFTDHPIQSNTSVVDHSFQLPDRVILSVAYSDAMQSYQNYWGSGGSKSVSAYQTFVGIQKSGAQVQLSTHLNSYPVMGIEEIRASDTNATAYGARFTVVFKQLITAQVSTTTVQSARSDQSQQTPTGTSQGTTVPQALLSSHTSTLNAATPPGAPNNPNPNPDWSSDTLPGEYKQPQPDMQ